MYWPWSFKLARRAGDSRSLRPRRVGADEARPGESRSRIKLAKDRAIAASERRMAWTFLATDFCWGMGKRASSLAVGVGEWYSIRLEPGSTRQNRHRIDTAGPRR